MKKYKPGARKSTPPGTRRTSVYLDPASLDDLVAIGGSITGGIRQLLEWWRAAAAAKEPPK